MHVKTDAHTTSYHIGVPFSDHLVNLVQVDDAVKHACLLALRAFGLLGALCQQLDRVPQGCSHASASQSADLAQLMATLQPKWAVQDVLQHASLLSAFACAHLIVPSVHT